MDRRKLVSQMRKSNAALSGQMLARIQQARDEVRARIAEANLSTDKGRVAVFKEIAGIHSKLATDLDKKMAAAAEKTISLTRKIAADEIGGGLSMRFDKSRLAQLKSLAVPGQGDSLAAIMTKKMGADHIAALRKSLSDVFRVADLEGWSARKRISELQSRWADYSKSLTPQAFIDKSGRQWQSAQYTQMLVRTTQARVSREAFNETVVQAGGDLVRVAAVGDSCRVCASWDGVILSTTGRDKRFPSYNDALAAGMFHPNCDCSLEAVDVDVDEKAIKAQAATKNPDEWTVETLQKYRSKSDLPPSEESEQRVDFAAEAKREFRKALS